MNMVPPRITNASTDSPCPPIPFGKRWIGTGFPVLVIAEIGINHEGDPDACRRMIESAVRAGADAVKLQIVDADESYVPGTDSHQIFKRSELDEKDVRRLFDYAKQLGVEMFATCGDTVSFDWFSRLSPEIYKISSGLLTHTPLIERIARSGKTMLMSTGMASDNDIMKALTSARKQGAEHIGLFQCTSIYPAPPETLNLAAIGFLQRKYAVPVGFSDHSLGILASSLAVAAGAHMIEKHFSFDPSRSGFDHHLSLNCKQFQELVETIRISEKMIGSSCKILSSEELENARKYHRYVVAQRDIPENSVLQMEHVSVMRLENSQEAIEPVEIYSIIGRKTNKNLKQFTPIRYKDLK